MQVLGEVHKGTLDTLNSSGTVCFELENYEKALEYFEKALKGKEKKIGKVHPETLRTVMSMGAICMNLRDFGEAKELFKRALEGYEAQLGKDHGDTKTYSRNFKLCLEESGNSERLAELILSYSGLSFEEAD
ncbi:hypothetical protein TL16_g10971 [Triparma laevis f. inornata]|uniref:Kinesin light chain n=1 Tax=Triparma laevis f. inornata TaxID=1714386 RepID=A0A9W7BIX7_9STRA|nr:hypothetical protein TL16_g10971 [Triparma laevis f. inornata]